MSGTAHESRFGDGGAPGAGPADETPGPTAVLPAVLRWVEGDRRNVTAAVLIAVGRRKMLVLADDTPPPSARVTVCFSGPWPTATLTARRDGSRRLRCGPYQLRLALRGRVPAWLLAVMSDTWNQN